MNLFDNLQSVIYFAFYTLTMGASTLIPSQQAVNNDSFDIAIDEEQISYTTGDNYYAQGEYSYLGQSIKYSLEFPKDGGPVNGNISGMCNGPISGDYKKQEGKAQGDINLSCDLLFSKEDYLVKYKASVDTQAKRIDLNWEGNTPLGNSGKVSLDLSE